MSWGIDFTTDIFLCHQDYGKNKYQVQDKIDEVKGDLARAISTISMLVAATPKDIVGEEFKDDILMFLSIQLQEALEGYTESTVLLYQLNLYLEYLEEQENVKVPDLSLEEWEEKIKSDLTFEE